MNGERLALQLGEYLIGVACRRLPQEIREERYREWTAELPYILHDTDISVAPIRVLRMLTFAADHVRGASKNSKPVNVSTVNELGGMGNLLADIPVTTITVEEIEKIAADHLNRFPHARMLQETVSSRVYLRPPKISVLRVGVISVISASLALFAGFTIWLALTFHSPSNTNFVDNLIWSLFWHELPSILLLPGVLIHYVYKILRSGTRRRARRR